MLSWFPFLCGVQGYRGAPLTGAVRTEAPQTQLSSICKPRKNQEGVSKTVGWDEIVFVSVYRSSCLTGET